MGKRRIFTYKKRNYGREKRMGRLEPRDNDEGGGACPNGMSFHLPAVCRLFAASGGDGGGAD